MWQLLVASENQLFSVALALMLLIALAELASLLLGQSLSDSLDSLLPDSVLSPQADVGAVEADTALSRLLGWLRVGQVPLLMLLVVFLLNFALAGLLLQGLWSLLVGVYLPSLLAAVVAFLLALPCVRFWGGILEKVLPRDETTAVSADTLIGRIGVITLGTARVTSPAEAKVKDEHGYSHYVHVVPDDPAVELAQGCVILLITREGGLYKVIENSNPYLHDATGRTDQNNPQ